MICRGNIPPWTFLIVGVIGVMLARGGLNMDLLCTLSDAMRTLAMIGVIVLGCIMMFRDMSGGEARPQPLQTTPAIPRIQHSTVTMSTQQFKMLLDMASQGSANALAAIQSVGTEQPAKESEAELNVEPKTEPTTEPKTEPKTEPTTEPKTEQKIESDN